MKFLIAILFLVLANCYVSSAMSVKKPFNNLSFNELKESCHKMNMTYNSLYLSKTDLIEEIWSKVISNCSDFGLEILIENIIDSALQCFDKDEHPNRNEMNTIIQEVRKKLCMTSGIVNFQKVNSECINLDDFNSCMAEPQVKISSLPDIYFDTLAMMYTAEECRAMKYLMTCMFKGTEKGCDEKISNQYSKMKQEYFSNMKCLRK